MRRDKTFAQTLLIFSIANFVLAAPVVVRQTRFDDFVLLPDLPDDETTGGSALLPHRVIDNHFANQSPGSSGSVAQGPPPPIDGSLHQDSAPVSVAPQSNDPAPVSRPVTEIEMVEKPNVQDVPDVHNDQDNYHNTDDMNKLPDKWSWADLARFTPG